MSSEYYTLEKAAEVLGLPTAEVNRLREKSELRAFRDGSSWKFRKVEVDNMLADIIKKRNKQQDSSNDSTIQYKPNDDANDDDFELLSGDELVELPPIDEPQDTSSFDAAMEDGFELDGELIDAPIGQNNSEPSLKSDLTDVNKIVDESPINLAPETSEVNEDDLVFSLADEQPADKPEPTTTNNNSNKSDDLVFTAGDLSLMEDDDLTLSDDDGLTLVEDDLSLAKDELTLAKDDLTLVEDDLTLADDSSSGSDNLSLDKQVESVAVADEDESIFDLAIDDNESTENNVDDNLLKSFSGDNSGVDPVGGLSVDSAAEEDAILFEIEDGNDTNAEAKETKDGAMFEPLLDDDFLELLNDDDSSTDMIAAGVQGTDEFNLTPDGFGLEDESESTSQFIPLNETNVFSEPSFGDALNSTEQIGDAPFQAGSLEGFSPPIHTSSSGTIYQQEVQYTPLMVGSFIAAAVLLLLPSVMLLDVIANIWGWNESIPVNSPILSMIGDLIGIKK